MANPTSSLTTLHFLFPDIFQIKLNPGHYIISPLNVSICNISIFNNTTTMPYLTKYYFLISSNKALSHKFINVFLQFINHDPHKVNSLQLAQCFRGSLPLYASLSFFFSCNSFVEKTWLSVLTCTIAWILLAVSLSYNFTCSPDSLSCRFGPLELNLRFVQIQLWSLLVLSAATGNHHLHPLCHWGL